MSMISDYKRRPSEDSERGGVLQRPLTALYRHEDDVPGASSSCRVARGLAAATGPALDLDESKLDPPQFREGTVVRTDSSSGLSLHVSLRWSPWWRRRALERRR